MTLKQLLSQTIRELHSLHTTQDPTNYETQLTNTVQHLLQLLNIKPGIPLTFHSSIGNFEILTFGNCPIQTNIIQYFTQTKQEKSNTLVELIDLISERTPTRIKHDYSLIFLKLSRIVQQLIQYQQQCQSQLIKYLCKCLNYQEKYYGKLQIKFENIDDDTERIAEIMDSLEDDSVEDSIFSYEDKEIPFEFKCNNELFEKLYRIMFEVLNFMKTNVRYEKLARVLVELFKNQQGIEFFQITDITEKILTNLLLENDEENKAILSRTFSDINKRVISNVISSVQEQKVESESEDETDTPIYSKSQQIQLFNDLKLLVPLLNEYTLGFQPEFPWLVSHYMKMMFIQLPTIVTEQDWQYLSQIQTLTTKLIEIDNITTDKNVSVIDIIDQFKHIHLLLCKDNYEIGESSLLMRYSTLDYYKSGKIVQIVWKGWRDSIWRCFQLHGILYEVDVKQENKTKESYLKFWFARAKKVNDMNNEVSLFYQIELVRKWLIQWKLHVAKSQQYLEIGDTTYMAKFLTRWKNKQKQTYQLELECRNIILNKYFQLIKQVYAANQTNYQVSTDLQAQFHHDQNIRIYSYYFLKWYCKMDNENLSNKLIQLKLLERKFKISIYFKKWVSNYRQIVQIQQFQINKNIVIRDAMFYKWMNNWMYQAKANTMIYNRNTILQRKIFQYWKMSLLQHNQASVVYANKLKGKYLSKLKQIVWDTLQFKRFDQSHVKRYLKLWLVKYKLKIVLGRKRRQVVELWKDNTKNRLVAQDNASEYYKTSLVKNGFHVWQGYMNNLSNYNQIEVFFFKQRYFKKLIRKYITLLDLSRKYQNNISNKISLKYTFTLWQQQYNLQYELRAQDKINHLHQTVTYPLLILSYFKIWINKYNQQIELLERCEQFYSVKPQLDMWIYKTRLRNIMYNEAIGFEISNLSSKFLKAWYDNYVTIQELEVRYQDYMDNYNFKLVSEMIKNWAMKYHKNIKRHQVQLEFLLSKFDNTRKRSIFELWKYKSENHEEFELANTPILSSSSPLTKRNQRQTISTPIKQTSPSPTKLQETTQRLKTEKIDKLRKHFAQVRISPINKYSRLSPPPNPPNFKIDDEEEDVISPTTIESAKSMKKIVPIKFPTDDQINLPKFSPISTLKERYRNQ